MGNEKSTFFWRSGVIVRFAAAMSPLPSASASNIAIAAHGDERDLHWMVFDLSRLLKLSNSFAPS